MFIQPSLRDQSQAADQALPVRQPQPEVLLPNRPRVAKGDIGAVMAIQTFGDYGRRHPHLDVIVADGLFAANKVSMSGSLSRTALFAWTLCACGGALGGEMAGFQGPSTIYCNIHINSGSIW
jgi:hypothetical protein